MSQQTTIPAPGFADATRDAQLVFRAILDALSQPGRTFDLVSAPEAPAPLGPALRAVALTLLDDDCTVWLDPELANAPAVTSWLAFHTGARTTDDPAAATFLFAVDVRALPSLAILAQGTDVAPHLSATVVLGVDPSTPMRTNVGRGPGIESTASIAVPETWPDFDAQWQANTESFPRGVDVVLVTGSCVTAIPRTTRLEREDI